MRVNVYAEEITDRVAPVQEGEFTGVRFYLELPVTKDGEQLKGPFIHRPGDDDSSAVTFWSSGDLRLLLRRAIEVLDEYYARGVERSAP